MKELPQQRQCNENLINSEDGGIGYFNTDLTEDNIDDHCETYRASYWHYAGR